jgi:transposase
MAAMKRPPKPLLTAPDLLQNKVQELQARLLEKEMALFLSEQQLRLKNQQIDLKNQQIRQKDLRIQILEEYVRLEKLRRYGQKSEKAVGQSELFNEVEMLAELDLPEPVAPDLIEAPAHPATRTNKLRPGRKPLPAELPRVRILHELSEDKRVCPCGCQLSAIGEAISEQLDIVPAQVRVLQHVRTKYACRACEQGVQTAPLPPQPIPKSQASPGLLAHLMVAKYIDAQPLHRQEKALARSQVHLPRQTQANWMIRASHLFQPLLNLMRDILLSGPYLHCDETRIQVLKEPDKPAESQSYMWVQVGGLPNRRVILYDYRDTRSGRVPVELLADYQGYLMVDGYEGYAAVGRQDGVRLLACWVHARRKFVEARQAQPKSSKTATRADQVIQQIAKLYKVERDGQALMPEARHQLRQERSLPILAELRAWLDATREQVLPSGKLGEAIAYLDKYWPRLVRYCEDGRLPIDNNPAENAIRPFVIGRKNWMFSATQKGAHASAAIYSLIETVRANGLEPYHYLRHVLKELPKAQSVEDYERLLPWNLTADTLIESRLADERGVG